MLHVVTVAAQAAAATGGDITVADALKVCVAAALTFLIMKQVPSMAQGLASGIALSGFGAVGNRASCWTRCLSRRNKRVKDFSRGAFIDRDKSRWTVYPGRLVREWLVCDAALRAATTKHNAIRLIRLIQVKRHDSEIDPCARKHRCAGCSTGGRLQHAGQARRLRRDATAINQPDAGGAPAPAAPANLSKSPQAGDEK